MSEKAGRDALRFDVPATRSSIAVHQGEVNHHRHDSKQTRFVEGESEGTGSHESDSKVQSNDSCPSFGKRKSVLEHPDRIKRHVLEQDDNLNVIEYNVEDLYKKEGCWQSISKSHWFGGFTMAMIVASTLWISIDTEYNHGTGADELMVFKIADNFQCVFFLVEIVIRLMSFENKWLVWTDMWFCFDFSLVSLMVWETWMSKIIMELFADSDDPHQYGGRQMASTFRIFRILRLTRVFRMSRVFRSVPELMILLSGMLFAIRSVCTALMLLLLMSYTFALLLTQLLANEDAGGGHFDHVVGSINYLLLCVICGWDVGFVTGLMNDSVVSYFLILLFILMGNLTLMNMLIGILVDVVGCQAHLAKEDQATKALKRQIEEIIEEVDEDSDGTVTADEFGHMLNDDDAVMKLHNAGVNVPALVDFSDFVFRDIQQMSLEDFVRMILQFRGDASASVQDIMNLRVGLYSELARIEHGLEHGLEKEFAGKYRKEDLHPSLQL